MGMYEKIKAAVNKGEGIYVLSSGKRRDTGIYGMRDKLINDGKTLVYYLWGIPIVEVRNNIVELWTGGWPTKITKERMNTVLSILNIPYIVEGKYETRRTEAGEWYVKNIDNTKTINFDGAFIKIVL